jgi:hypothetical protein
MNPIVGQKIDKLIFKRTGRLISYISGGGSSSGGDKHSEKQPLESSPVEEQKKP